MAGSVWPLAARLQLTNALHCTVLYNTVMYFTALCYTALYALRCTTLHFITLCYTILYYTVLYCTLLYCAIPHYTALHYTVCALSVLHARERMRCGKSHCTVRYLTAVVHCTACAMLRYPTTPTSSRNHRG
jgi:hypothetical protein